MKGTITSSTEASVTSASSIKVACAATVATDGPDVMVTTPLPTQAEPRVVDGELVEGATTTEADDDSETSEGSAATVVSYSSNTKNKNAAKEGDTPARRPVVAPTTAAVDGEGDNKMFGMTPAAGGAPTPQRQVDNPAAGTTDDTDDEEIKPVGGALGRGGTSGPRRPIVAATMAATAATTGATDGDADVKIVGMTPAAKGAPTPPRSPVVLWTLPPRRLPTVTPTTR